VLKQGGILALLIDRDIRTPSLSVPFFGRLARTPAAAAVLAVRRDAPVLPVFAQRRPAWGHHFTVMAPIYPTRTSDRQRDIFELTHRLSQLLEEQIRRNPAEWNWWNRRWRRAPVPGLDLDAQPRPSRPVSP
jgi:KDO2-lipid IV(A) lauroyltransferase